MKRMEIIANRSVQNEIVEALEESVDRFYYTLLPVVNGSGRQLRRMGTPTWPEENFLLIAYVDDQMAEIVTATIRSIKADFPNEGIKLFAVAAEM
ncbi:MAG: PG0541 family transporter-associated protein [Treponemataceae bacterium]